MYWNDRWASGPSAVGGTSPPWSQHHSTPRICTLWQWVDTRRQRQTINVHDVASSSPLCATALERHFNHIKMEFSGFPIPKTHMWMCQTLHFLSWPLERCFKRVARFKITTCGAEVYTFTAIFFFYEMFPAWKLHGEGHVTPGQIIKHRIARAAVARVHGDHGNNTDMGCCVVTTQTDCTRF